MTNFLEDVKITIYKELKPENVTLIDNSKLHSKHKSFDPKKFHIKLIIDSKKLKSMNKLDSHKLIYSILKKEMQNQIHALEIEIN